jgi:hypothetical protein
LAGGAVALRLFAAPMLTMRAIATDGGASRGIAAGGTGGNVTHSVPAFAGPEGLH